MNEHSSTTPSKRRRLLLSALAISTAVFPGGAGILHLYGRERPLAPKYDAIVVAGCRVEPDGRPSNALAARTRLAVLSLKQGKADRIVFTGGAGDQSSKTEARAAAELALSLGVPASVIVEEGGSTSTEENARFAAELLSSSAKVLLVTDAYHVFRAERVFRRYFAHVDGIGSVGEFWATLKGAHREVVALSAYAILGRI